MKTLVIFLVLVAWAHAASLKTEKRANGDVGCLYNGVFEYLGSRFASLDGCNSCTCTATGVQCSTNQCRIPGTGGLLGGNNCVGAGNQVYRNGQTYTAPDGCNTCTCTNGNIACTQLATCTGTVNLAGTCVNSATSQLYQNGQTYPSSDGCNTCTCNNGRITCTTKFCGGTGPGGTGTGTCVGPANQVVQNGQTYTATDGCNTCTCRNGVISCTQQQCSGHTISIGTNNHPGGNSHTGVTCYDNFEHRFHNDGDTYSSRGGCNTCTCSAGILTCTNRQCNTGTAGSSCVDLATQNLIANGASVKASDGCNTCMCRNGRLGCTSLPCFG